MVREFLVAYYAYKRQHTTKFTKLGIGKMSKYMSENGNLIYIQYLKDLSKGRYLLLISIAGMDHVPLLLYLLAWCMVM